MEQNINESPTGTPVTIKIIYELGMGKKFCRELDKNSSIKTHGKNAFRIMNAVKKIFMKILHLKHD